SELSASARGGDAEGARGDDLVGPFGDALDGGLAWAEGLVRQFGPALDDDVAAHVQGLLGKVDIGGVAVGIRALGDQLDLAAQGRDFGLAFRQVLDQQDVVIHPAVFGDHVGAADPRRGAGRIGGDGLDQAGDAGLHVGGLLAQLLGAGGLFLLVLPRLLDLDLELFGFDGQALVFQVGRVRVRAQLFGLLYREALRPVAALQEQDAYGTHDRPGDQQQQPAGDPAAAAGVAIGRGLEGGAFGAKRHDEIPGFLDACVVRRVRTRVRNQLG